MQDLDLVKSTHRYADDYWIMSRLLFMLRDLNIKSAFPAASEAWRLYIEELIAERSG